MAVAAASVVGGALGLCLIASFATGRFAVENARYHVLRQVRGFEVRQYAPHFIAEAVVDGDMNTAGSSGFRRIAAYIFGHAKIAMTTPVALEPTGRAHAVRFILPQRFSDPSAPPPVPLDERVTTRFVPSTLLCARALPMTLMHSRLGGARFEQAAAALVRDVESGGFVVVGRVMQLSYDPPWTPFFARRDEVAVEVREV